MSEVSLLSSQHFDSFPFAFSSPLTDMSEMEVLLSRSASAMASSIKEASCCGGSSPVRGEENSTKTETPKKDICTVAVAQHLLKIEEHLRTQPPSTGIAAGLYCLATPIPDFCQLVALECKVKSHALRHHLAEVVEKLRRKQQVTDAVTARARQVFDPDCPENHKRLEQMWTLFFDYKPLPPSFQHCSSFTNNSAAPPCRQRSVTASPSQASTSTVSRATSARSTSCSASLTSTASSPLPSNESPESSFLSQCPEKHRQGARGNEEPRDTPDVDSTASPESGDTPQLLTQSSSWGELGFQHPLRDFRAAGCLAADCLLFLGGRFPSHARRLLQQSHEETFWMPFAVTSINVVDWLLHMMNRRLLDIFFLACGDDGFWDRDGLSVSEQRSLLIEPRTSGPPRAAKASGVSNSNISSAEKNQKDSHSSHQGRRGERSQDVNCTMSPVKESEEAVPQVFFFLFVAVLSHFCRFWRSRKPENIMQFGKVCTRETGGQDIRL
ncbi:elmo ced-12 family protein [Cystoisospora suis]|uniref:Elmo ced-12 family protein n=1 Tax=Cystoisospora suis TaxID=483139 RepID=A0A2C6KRC5_9APIC|nr:elmo ced-12 family protein [Cystoisospora suis]